MKKMGNQANVDGYFGTNGNICHVNRGAETI